MIESYKDLLIWKLGREIIKEIYQLTGTFPSTQTFSLCNQMQRAALSIVSNIAEGYHRQTTKEYRQFLYIAFGSCAELETQIIIAEDLKFISRNDFEKLVDKVNQEQKMIKSLIRKLN